MFYICVHSGLQVVGAEISNFEFTPKPEFEGPFIIFNEANEEALLHRFFSHMREVGAGLGRAWYVAGCVEPA